MKYACNQEGVDALKKMAQAISDASEEIIDHAGQLKDVGEGPDLGPHSDSIVEAAESIEDAISKAADPIEEIAETLEDVAEGYEDVIGNDRIRSAGN